MSSFVTRAQEAPCQYFGRCGGCKFQNISNHGEYKFFLFMQALKEIEFNGNIHPLAQIALASRRRVTFKINNKKLSFNQFHSTTMIAIGKCLLLEDAINALIIPINQLLKNLHIRMDMLSITNSDTGLEILFYSQERSDMEADLLLTEFARIHNIAKIAWQIKKQSPYNIIQFKPVQLKFDDIYVDLPINNFLQVSKESTDLMTRIILQHLSKAKKILELYCGCGSFTIPISVHGNITAIEGSAEAVEALRKTIKLHQLPINVIKQDLYQNPYPSSSINAYSQVIINPPRNGATPQIRQIAAASAVQKVILISCSLENFIRDTKILLNNNFKLSDIYPIDQFLYSDHLEIIGIFERYVN